MALVDSTTGLLSKLGASYSCRYGSVLIHPRACCSLILWDMADYFILDLAFPGDLLDRYTFALPMVLLIFIVVLDRESKKLKAPVEAEERR